MTKILILLGLLGGAAYWYKSQQQASLNPEEIVHPTYAEIRWRLDVKGRSFDRILFAKVVNQQDCEKFSTGLIAELTKIAAANPAEQWILQSSECKENLLPRYAIFFEDKPTHVTYVKVARGDRREREARLIYWGVSADESNKVCDGISEMAKNRKGAVTCVRAVPL